MLQGPKKNNHSVPRSLLMNWRETNNSEVGVHFLVCSTGQVMFEPGKKARFAISEFQYVPVRGSNRDEDLENWFSVDEEPLARLSKQANGDVVKPPMSPADFGKAFRAALSLAYRSTYEYSVFRQQLSAMLPTLTPEEIHLKTVDHFWGLYTTAAQRLDEFDCDVIHDLPGGLLIGDRPSFDLRVRGLKIFYLPLSPTSLLVATPKKRPESVVGWISGRDRTELVRQVNKQTVERSRLFIVGQLAALKEWKSELTPAKFNGRALQDRTVAF